MEKVTSAVGAVDKTLKAPTDWTITFQAAFDACGCNSTYISNSFTEEDLPAPGTGQEQINIGLRKRTKTTTTQEWLDLLDLSLESGEKFCHPLSLLAAVVTPEHRNEYLMNPIFTIWKSPRTGCLWELFVGWLAGKRTARVTCVYSRDEWESHNRAGVIDK